MTALLEAAKVALMHIADGVSLEEIRENLNDYDLVSVLREAIAEAEQEEPEDQA